jgi:regulator of RNase E activity RraA
VQTPLTATVLDLLRQYDTPTICNVLELCNARPRTDGYLNEKIVACYPKLPPMVGYALTATFRAGSPPRSGDVYAGLSEQVKLLAAAPKPAVIVFQDLDVPTVAATFGEVMCTTYQAFGAVGLITSGTGRDLDQVEALRFPCFTAGTVASHGYCQIVQLNVPVSVGGVTIYPGDLLHGDRNGVTTVPGEWAEVVAAACAEFVAAETIVLDYLKRGNVEPSGYAAVRQACHEQLTALGQRMRARRGG